jgi:hypothetical protein
MTAPSRTFGRRMARALADGSARPHPRHQPLDPIAPAPQGTQAAPVAPITRALDGSGQPLNGSGQVARDLAWVDPADVWTWLRQTKGAQARPWLYIADICEFLEISPAKFFAMRAASVFPIEEMHPRIGRPRFAVGAVEAWLRSQIPAVPERRGLRSVGGR